MKKITYTISFAFAVLASSNAIAQQGFGTNRPDKSSAIEIKSPNKGLLIPRVTLTSLTDVTTIVNPANSLLVYNTTVNSALNEGFYYYNTTLSKWIAFTDESNQDKVTVTQDGQNLSVVGTPTTNANGSTTTDYKVKIVPAATEKQFLATTMVGTELQTTWVSYDDIMEATNGLTKVGNTIKLGGTLTEDTTLVTAGHKVMVQGLTQVTDMTDQVVAVGHYQTGEVKVATPKQIVDKGIDNNLSSSVNTMTSTVNGDVATASIINSNDLSIDANSTVLKSSVNGVEDTQDLKEAIQTGQIKYDVTAGTGITIDTTGSTVDLKTFKVGADLANITLNGDVTGAANNNTVAKIQNVAVSATAPTAGQVLKEVSGVWTPSTLTVADITAGKTLSSTDLDVTSPTNKALLEDVTINIKDNAVTAAKLNDDTAGAGLVRNATTKALDVNAKNGLNVGSDDFVKLGGALTEATTITTDATNTLALAGLQDYTDADKTVLVIDANNVVRKANINTANAIATKTADYAALATDETILVDATSNHVIVTIPAATTENKGKRFYVKLIATNAANTNEVRITSSSMIDGLAGPNQIESSNPYQAWLLQSDGMAWYVVGY
ncbi:hypothetical protein P3875_00425 [Myroides sp. JBRI-B21084]|uniref:hypothetical protein n=1 Tax=Myroides sp. JBRI-B21084 TaxID=3119977 RepID=UPI0026E2EC8E|nr:hypothetical protein [Paenimyroides cloacae]WKW46579.1 hypothetical protein P3875_00425 [Paenimyroides cloacae]